MYFPLALSRVLAVVIRAVIRLYASILGLMRKGKKLAPYLELQMLLENYNGAMPPDILYLGDSVLLRISREDDKKDTLDRMFAEKVADRFRVLGVAHTAYHLLVYKELIHVLKKTVHRPKIVFLPINLRSFSPQWDYHPSWQFRNEIQAAQSYWSNLTCVDIYNDDERLPNKTLLRLYDSIPVYYPEIGLKTIGYFRNIINAKPDNEQKRKYRLQNVFRFHYMHELVGAHPKLNALTNIMKLAAEMGIYVIVYVTPVNWQAGQRYMGNSFINMVKSNVSLIKAQSALERFSPLVSFSDFSLLLDSDCFFSEDNSTEHLNEKGREILSDQLKELLPDLIKPYGVSIHESTY